MKPTFTIKLGQPIFPGLVTCGKFDGKTPSIAFATTGGKIIVHSPHDHSVAADGSSNNALRHLNLNRKITSLVAGSLGQGTHNLTEFGEGERDVLFVGTQSNLLAYDVERNADVFFCDVQDGVNCLCVGSLGSSSKKMVVAGGNCSILGFDGSGSECFWTVTGDNVSALAFVEDGDNINNGVKNTLLAGSEDFEIRSFRGEESLFEISEADKVILLHGLPNGRVAYGLSNGTVGVYDCTGGQRVRMWRVKTKHKPTAIFSYDIDLDGQEEIFVGWSNGLLTVRRAENGSVLFREMFDAPIASILKVDYRMDGKEEVIVCTEAGSITGYLPSDADFGALFDSGVTKENAEDQKAIDELHRLKLELAAEAKLIEKQLKAKTSSSSASADSSAIGALPPNTSLTYDLRPDRQSQSLQLRIEASSDVQIMNVIVVDQEGVLLEGGREAVAFAPKNLVTSSGGRSVCLSLRPQRHQAAKLRVQTHLAARSLTSYLHVFETDISVPRFAAFCELSEPYPSDFSGDGVVFSVKDGLERFVSYFTKSFVLTQQPPAAVDLQQLKFFFQSVKASNSGGPIEFLKFSGSRQKENGQMMTRIRIQCESMELAGDVVQDMAKYFGWTELSSETDFPNEWSILEEVLERVNACNAARTSLTADMADDSARIKALIIRAEDSRLMMDMNSMRKSYTELTGLNNGLIGAYNIRMKNHDTLVASLKEVNQMIQRSANLRIGDPKNRLVSDSRAAVKENRIMDISRILQKGFDSTTAV